MVTNQPISPAPLRVCLDQDGSFERAAAAGVPIKMKSAKGKGQSTYSEKLRDPRWQKKRLEIMERDGFKCRACGSGTDTLNVHHLYYDKGASPWEYENDALITLCESCHENVEAKKKAVLKTLTTPRQALRVIRFMGFERYGAAAGEASLAFSGFIDAVDKCFAADIENGFADEVEGLESAFSWLVTMMVYVKDVAFKAMMKEGK